MNKVTCGCCDGNGSNDKCICVIHQDAPRGRQAHKCDFHVNELASEYESRMAREMSESIAESDPELA